MTQRPIGKPVELEPTSNPHELYQISYLSPYGIDLLEKNLAGLPMKAAREIDFCRFKKLLDSPYGHIRYNVLDSLDTDMGYIEMEKHRAGTTVIFQYKVRYDDIFKKIHELWENYIDNDLELSRIAEKKLEEKSSNQIDSSKTSNSAKPSIPKQTKRLNDWKAAWRKIKGPWKGGSSYSQLSEKAQVSPKTIAKIVKAGDAGLLD